MSPIFLPIKAITYKANLIYVKDHMPIFQSIYSLYLSQTRV